jgi:ABC-type dipeptide/oligopeptide/nickel transport system ATPase component
MRGPEMGMIFQNTGASLCPIRTIEDQLYESVLEHENLSKKEIKDKAIELFDKMNLKDGERILKSYPFELSGGMNQRVGIMMGMILEPDLLFADEPTSALDVTVQAQVVKEMMKMRELYGTAIAIVTHNIGVVEYMADKVAVMYHGDLVEYGTVDEVIHHPKEDYTKKLISAVLRIDRG